MTIYNLGSINADLLYQVPHLPQAGETLAATSYQRGLGGKGTNMSVAAARAASRVVHIGAVGPDGDWAIERLMEYGVDTRQIATVNPSTGHAIIALDEAGENSILLYPGANHAVTETQIADALTDATSDDLFVFQNETNAQLEAATQASSLGMRVAYAAAPFSASAVKAVLPLLDLLVLNSVEKKQLETELNTDVSKLGVRDVIVTLGSDGCEWINGDSGAKRHFEAVQVEPIDTTGAGDTFTGYLVAGLDRGMPLEQSIRIAIKAAAIMVTRTGTADVIPDLKDVLDFDG